MWVCHYLVHVIFVEYSYSHIFSAASKHYYELHAYLPAAHRFDVDCLALMSRVAHGVQTRVSHDALQASHCTFAWTWMPDLIRL